MAAAPQSPTPRRSLLPSERRREIVNWVGGGLAGCFFVALIWFPDYISRFFSAIPPSFMPFVASVLFCVVTLFEVGGASLTVPARLQLMLYGGAVLAGLVWTWAASLIDNYWFGILSFIIIAAALRIAADQLIKNSRAQEK